MTNMILDATQFSTPQSRSAGLGLSVRTLAAFCLGFTALSPCCVERALGQTVTWDLAADWNGRNPIDAYWSLSGGPTAHRWRGFESFGGDFNSGCPHSFIVKCIGSPTTQECPGAPHVVSLSTGQLAWHTNASITWNSNNFCGTIAITAAFQDHPGQNGATDLIVTKNGTELWRYHLVGGTVTFARTLDISGTNQIVFTISDGGDGIAEDTVNISSLTIVGTPTAIPASAWTGTAGDGEWDTAANWSPSGRPADNAGASFNLAAPATVSVPAGRKVGGFAVNSGTLNLVVSDGTLSSPTSQCLPIGGSLLLGASGETAGFSLFGEMLCDRLVAVCYDDHSSATLGIDTYGTLRTQSGIVLAYGNASTGIINVDGRGRLLQSGSSISLARGQDSFGTINLTNGGTLRYGATPLRVGNGPGATGIINITGSFEGVSSLIPSGSGSQILLGAESTPPGGVTTTGTINLHDRGFVRATEIRLGTEVRTRGSLVIDGGTLDTQSLIIADKGDGLMDWSGGTITGLRQITLGNTNGTSGRLDLDGPGRSLTLASPIGGETQNLYAGKSGRGVIVVANGAAIILSSGSVGGLSVGGTDPVGAGSVQILGHDPDNVFFRSRIVGSANSVLNVGRTYAVVPDPAFLIDGGRATFGSVHVGHEDWMDGEIHIRNNGVLQQIRPGADAFGSNDGLEIRGTPFSAGGGRLLVTTGGQVECTSGIAFNTYAGGPVVTVTGAGSKLTCSGGFYIAGDAPVGGKMRIDSGATVSSADVLIARAGLPGELTLSGPAEALTVSGTLAVGVDGDPATAGKLILQNGAKVRAHRLLLGANQSITTDIAGPPAILVGGSPLLPPDIQCDTLISSDTFNPPGLAVSYSADAGIGGHGTWSGSFDSLGEIVVPDLRNTRPEGPMPHLTIDGDLFQHPSSVVEVVQNRASWNAGDGSAYFYSFVNVNGVAHVSGTVRLTLWTTPLPYRQFSFLPQYLIGATIPVLTATSVTGTFAAVEFGPGFPTNRAQLTYEPTQVLVTPLPPVCNTSIGTQPTDQTACTEASASFAVSVIGSDEFSGRVTYQWQQFVFLGGDGGPQWLPINDDYVNYHISGNAYHPLYSAAGITTPDLTLTFDPGFFYEPGNPNVPIRCVITNACNESIISNAVTLTVNAPPVIDLQPANATACVGSPAVFTVAASGSASITYQWQWQPSGSEGEWHDLLSGDNAGPAGLLINAAGVTAATLTLSPLPAALDVSPRSLRCVITNACGSGSIISDTSTLMVEACAPCPADFNQDGGIDGADVSAFFASWENGDPVADVNADGGIDGADIPTFFAAWEAGGCG